MKLIREDPVYILSGGASIVETSQEKYRRLGVPYIRKAGFEEGMKYYRESVGSLCRDGADTPIKPYMP